MRKTAVSLLLLVVISPFGLAQQDPANYQAGLPVNAAQIPIPLGAVNALTGNVYLEIPLVSIPERNGIPVVAKLTYNTSLAHFNYNGGGGYLGGGGWSTFKYGTEVALHYATYDSQQLPCQNVGYPNGSNWKSLNFRVVDPSGATHVMGGYTIKIGCYDNNGNYESQSDYPGTSPNLLGTDTDGSGYNFSITNFNVIKADLNGVVFWDPANGVMKTYDPNGNIMELYGPNQDTLGRAPITLSNPGFCKQGVTSASLYVKVSDGSTQTYTMNCQAYSVVEAPNPPGTIYLMSSLLLPNGSQYSFSYDTGTTGTHTGRLTSLTLSTGGQVAFGYASAAKPVSSVTYGGGTWNFSLASFGTGSSQYYVGTVTAPPRYDSALGSNVNDKTVYTSVTGGAPFLAKAQYYSGASTLLKTVSITYGPSSALQTTATTTLNDTSQTSKITYQYWLNLRDRPSQIQEWDFGAATPTRTTKFTYGIYNKPTSAAVYAGDGTSGLPLSNISYAYDEYTANYCTGGVPMLTSITGATSHDDTNHGLSFTARGNLTSISRWVSGSTWVTSHKCYDTLGNVTQEVDESGHATNYDYTERWADSTCIPTGTLTRAFPTTITNAVGNRVRSTRFSCSSLTQATADENDIAAGRPGRTYTYDFSGRQLFANYPDGGQTTMCYSDVPSLSCYNSSLPRFSTTSTLINTGVGNKTTKTVLDGYGRESQTQLTSDPEGTDYTDTTYDALGHVATMSNPYRSTTDATYGSTRSYYDALGRTTLVSKADGSTATTSYSGNTVIITDEAGKKRKSASDALGRLTTVWEDPLGFNYETDYFYDVLGNLTCVQEKGGVSTPSGTGCAYSSSGDNNSPWRIRRFVYDGLSRLTNASNPESGTISYTYDSSGNLLTKLAPIPNKIPADTSSPQTVTTTYFYDAVNRLIKKTYTDGTATVQYGYDGTALTGCTYTVPTLSDTNPKGRRTSMCDASGATHWALDITSGTGWKTTEARKIGSLTKNIITQNNFGGMTYQLTYPGGHVLTYTPNGSTGTAGRYASAVDSAISVNYVQNATYGPFGNVTGMANGSAPITITNSYNERLQPVTLSAATGANTLFSRSFDFHRGNGNSGNVFQVINNLDNARSQSFSYDALNRIASAQSQATTGTKCWGDSFTIDSWGNLTNKIPNRTGTGCVGENLNAPATTKNQMSGYCYDKAGNLLGTSGCPSLPYTPTYTYDAENRLLTAGGVTYTYDGDGNRAKKSNGTLYWGSGPLSESDLSGNIQRTYIFFNGQRVARRDVSNNSVHYYYSDHLGSHSVIANSSGTLPLEEDLDYYPYGGIAYGTPSDHYEFTGKERDSESGLDNFGARYHASTMGHFMSPDPAMNFVLRAINPQRWNQYAYAINNATNYVDPDGRDAAAVNFSGMVGGLGHEGLLVINKDGSSTYARFGPQDHSLGNLKGASAPGVVLTFNNIPTVQFGANGLPTDASIKEVAAAVAQDEGADPNTVRINYFQTGSTDTAILNEWVQLQQEHSQNGQGPYGHYCVVSNNCATFTATGLVVSEAITDEQARRLSTDPNLMFLQLSRLANDNFDLLQMQIKPPEKACVTTYGPDGPDTHCE